MHDQHGTAAGHAVAARGGDGVARPVNREPPARRNSRLESLAFGRAEDANSEYSIYLAIDLLGWFAPGSSVKHRTSRASRREVRCRG